jgi:transketolase C-terminal domain/subunit
VAAVTWVELTYVVVRALPLNWMTVAGMNPLPEIVIFVPTDPTGTNALLRLVMTGTGLSTSRLAAGEVVPPPELVTATLR